MTVSRGPLDADTFGGRAPILPRVITPVCFDPSHYSKRVQIANVMWRVEGAFISYKALIYPFFRSMPVISGGQKIICPTEDSCKEKLVASPSPTKCFCFHYTADVSPHGSNSEAFRIRGKILGNSCPFRCVCCNSREEITFCNTEGQFISVSCLPGIIFSSAHRKRDPLFAGGC